MTSYTDEGIVIKRRSFGETDKLVTLFSRHHGKITLKAKGIRAPTSKRVGSLELFNHVRFHSVRGRGELDILTEVQLINSFYSWRRYLGRVTMAYQLAEVVDKLTPDHLPHPEVFDLLRDFLFEIGSLKIDWKLKIENWKLRVLQELGFLSRDKEFVGDIDRFIEELINRPLHSPKLLQKLK